MNFEVVFEGLLHNVGERFEEFKKNKAPSAHSAATDNHNNKKNQEETKDAAQQQNTAPMVLSTLCPTFTSAAETEAFLREGGRPNRASSRGMLVSKALAKIGQIIDEAHYSRSSSSSSSDGGLERAKDALCFCFGSEEEGKSNQKKDHQQQDQSAAFAVDTIIKSAKNFYVVASKIARDEKEEKGEKEVLLPPRDNGSQQQQPLFTFTGIANAAKHIIDSLAPQATAVGDDDDPRHLSGTSLLSKVFHNRDANHKLERFVKAQNKNGVYDLAKNELKHGQKRSCWIWWTFPQFLDPGRSSLNNSTFQIHGQIEAVAYVLHPVLGPRIHEMFALVRSKLEGADSSKLSSSSSSSAAAPAVHHHQPIAARILMGTGVDAKKLHHSASTFWHASESLISLDGSTGGRISQQVGSAEASRHGGGEENDHHHHRDQGNDKNNDDDNDTSSLCWQRVLALRENTAAVIRAIAKAPYPLPAELKGVMPFHDPVMVAAWNKSEVWH